MSKRIIFFGTPPFAVKCLEKIVEEKFDIVAVVTAPDRPAGRGRQIRTSAVKDFAQARNIPILQPTQLKDPEFTIRLRELKPDVMIVVAFRMLPKVVWSIPPFGTFNLHASLLPEYRGAAPINWAIINREKYSGVTSFFINEEIDTGAILLQEKVDIEEYDTAGSFHDKLSVKGSGLVCKTIKGIFEGSLIPLKQEIKETEKVAPKLNKENIFIHWDQPLEIIHAKIKGLSPYPGARSNWIEDNKKTVVKIFEAEIVKEKHNFTPNQVIIKGKKILIAHPSGFLNCTVLQLPNKKKMNAIDLLNGSLFSNKLEVS
jgi:methionyl-tRNA formyltransferase